MTGFHLNDHWHRARLLILLLVPLSVVPILAGWVGDVAKAYLEGETLSDADPWLFGVGLIGIPVLALWVLVEGRKLLPAKVVEQTAAIAVRRVVVALLSPCRNLLPPTDGADPSGWRVQDTTGVETSLKGLGIDAVIDPAHKLPQWSWQQTLRAAHHHRDVLEQLVLIGSVDGSGRTDQLCLAQRFFAHYLPDKVRILGAPALAGGSFDPHWQADFEKLDDLTRLLLRVLKELHREPHSYVDKDVIIDCTGGQKIASIACALVTLDRPDLMFQYVGTGARAGKLLGFNVVTETRAD